MTDEQELGFQLDKLEYDWLIIGTGFEESLYAAHLAKIAKQQVLVLDIASQYACNSRTMNFKEFDKLPEELPKTQEGIHKKPIFTLLELNEQEQLLNKEFANLMNSGHNFKYFNIDLMPKLLYSDSPTVKLMQQADMDQYLDFKAIEMQYFYDKQKQCFFPTPTSKSDIFKCGFLSLQEKKYLFQLLHTLIRLYHKITNYQIDQNSTQEFDQNSSQLSDSTIQQFQELKEKPAIEFLNKIINTSSKDKIFAILFYSICFQNESFNSNKSLNLNDFILRFGKYIKSMGIHTAAPFLYTNYGTGDIAQGFCRMAAVNTATYIISQKLKIKNINYEDLTIDTNLNKEQLKINKGIVMPQQVWQSIKKNEQEENEQLFRCIIITTKDLSGTNEIIQQQFNDWNKEQEQQNINQGICPSLYVIPCQILSEHPIYIFRTNNSSNSTHKNYECFQVKTIIGKQDGEELKKKISKIIQEIDFKESKSLNYICFQYYFIMNSDNQQYQFQPDQNRKIYVTSPESYDLDFDNQSQEFMKNIKIINQDFIDDYYLKNIPNQNQQIEAEYPQDNVTHLLQQIENIKEQKEDKEK